VAAPVFRRGLGLTYESETIAATDPLDRGSGLHVMSLAIGNLLVWSSICNKSHQITATTTCDFGLTPDQRCDHHRRASHHLSGSCCSKPAQFLSSESSALSSVVPEAQIVGILPRWTDPVLASPKRMAEDRRA